MARIIERDRHRVEIATDRALDQSYGQLVIGAEENVAEPFGLAPVEVIVPRGSIGTAVLEARLVRRKARVAIELLTGEREEPLLPLAQGGQRLVAVHL